MNSSDEPLANEVFETCRLTHLQDNHREMLLRFLKPHRFHAGLDISEFAPTQHGQVIFMVEGRIKVSLRSENHFAFVFGVFGPGSIFADLWQETAEVLNITIETLERTRMWYIDTSDFEAILKQEPELAIELLKRFEKDNNTRWQHTLRRMHEF